MLIKEWVRKGFNFLGYDIYKNRNSPRINLLGLRNYAVRTIIDVGANTGQFAQKIATVFPEARIYSFEPLPEAFAELRKWAEQQPGGKVTAFNVALGEQEGEATMFKHQVSGDSSLLRATEVFARTFYQPEVETVSVPLTSLDNWVRKQVLSLGPEVLIKLDVQGYENYVISGGQETFRQAKIAIMEAHLDYLFEGQSSFKDLLISLDRLGFRYAGNLAQSYGEDGHVVYVDALYVK